MRTIEQFQLRSQKSKNPAHKEIFRLVKLMVKEELEMVLREISENQVVVRDADGHSFYGGTFVRFEKLSEIINDRCDEVGELK